MLCAIRLLRTGIAYRSLAIWRTAFMALLMSVAGGIATAATPLSSTGSTTLTHVYAAADLNFVTREDSSFIDSVSITNPDFYGSLWTIDIPAIALPTGATVTVAQLTWSLPYVSQLGSALLRDFSPVNGSPGHNYRLPTLGSLATLYALPLILSAGPMDYDLSRYSGNSLDLLAAGFGPSLLAGTTLSLQGMSGIEGFDWSFIPGHDQYGDEIPPDHGFNVNAEFQLYVPFQDAPLSATLALDYALAPGVPEPQSWALMLAGFGLIGGTIRARRRNATLPTG